jgi:hypothetical protein
MILERLCRAETETSEHGREKNYISKNPGGE